MDLYNFDVDNMCPEIDYEYYPQIMTRSPYPMTGDQIYPDLEGSLDHLWVELMSEHDIEGKYHDWHPKMIQWKRDCAEGDDYLVRKRRQLPASLLMPGSPSHLRDLQHNFPHAPPSRYAPDGYDPLGDPRMVPFVKPNMIDDYSLRYKDAPWAPFPVMIPSYGRFTNFVGRQNVPRPYHGSKQPTMAALTAPLDRPMAIKPQKQYLCDGHCVKDDIGRMVALLKAVPEGSEISSPQGKPWLRYNRAQNAIINVDPNNSHRGFNDVVAKLSEERHVVYNGDQRAWKDPANPPVLYEYQDSKAGTGDIHIFIYDAKDHRQIADVVRNPVQRYPTRMNIVEGIPYHLLLIALFLI